MNVSEPSNIALRQTRTSGILTTDNQIPYAMTYRRRQGPDLQESDVFEGARPAVPARLAQQFAEHFRIAGRGGHRTDHGHGDGSVRARREKVAVGARPGQLLLPRILQADPFAVLV